MAEDPLLTFVEQYAKDREAGAARGLSEYLAMFPGDPKGVAREFLRFEDRDADTTPTSSGGVEDEDSLGPYRLKKELGRGGQGVVYLAEDTRLGRKVALKVLKGLGPGSEEVLLRFKREAAVASRLDDPGICAVYDTGIENGIPYIAMRFVDGDSLADKISTLREVQTPAMSTCIDLENLDENDLDTDLEEEDTTSTGPGTRDELMRVVRLFEQVARSLDAAHEAGVIHRDIKPGNIMVTKGGSGVIMDFGLARAEEEDLPTLTRSGDLFGTPAYMSPEQLTRQSVRLDARTDVWSLGVALYECLTLKRPFEAPTREGLFQAIMTKEPLDPRKANTLIPRDLATVLLVALEKDRDRRYQSADALAGDLERVRKQRPVEAKPVGSVVRVMRWAQRNRAVAASLVAVLVLLSAGLALTVSLLAVAERERDEKDVALVAVKQEKAAKEEEATLKTAALERTRRLLQKSEGLRLTANAEGVLDEDPALALLLGLEAAEHHRTPMLRRVFEDAFEDLREIRTVPLPPGQAHSLVGLAFDGSHVAVLSRRTGTLRIVRTSTGEYVATVSGALPSSLPGRKELTGPKGRHFVVIVRGEDRRRAGQLWDLVRGELRSLSGWAPFSSVALATLGPKEDVLAVAYESGAVPLIGLDSGKVITTLEARKLVRPVVFSPDGTCMAAVTLPKKRLIPLFRDRGRRHQAATVWDTRTGRIRFETSEAAWADFASDGRLLRTRTDDDRFRLWNVMTGEELPVPEAASDLELIALSPAFRRTFHLANDSDDIHVTDTMTGQKVGVLEVEGLRGDLSCDQQGRRVVTLSGNATLWDLEPCRRIGMLSMAQGQAVAATFSPDGRRVAVHFESGPVGIFDASDGSPIVTLSGHSGTVQSTVFSSSGEYVATLGTVPPHDSGTVRVWSLRSLHPYPETVNYERPPRRTWGGLNCSGTREARKVSLPDGGHGLRITDLQAGKTVADMGEPIDHCVWSPDGRHVLVSTPMDRNARARVFVLDATDGSVIWELDGGPGMVTALAWSGDGRRIVTTRFWEAHLWDVPGRKLVAELPGHQGTVSWGAFQPDGLLVATLSEDRVIRLWSSETGALEGVVNRRGLTIGDPHFSADGRWIMAKGKEVRGKSFRWPLDVVDIARRSKPRELTPEERDRFLIGTLEERIAYRQAWRQRHGFADQ